MSGKKPTTYQKAFEVEVVNNHKDIRDVSNQFAIYSYIWNSEEGPFEKDEVLYIGKDSLINKSNRRSKHQQMGYLDAQQFHKELYKYKDNVRYEIVCIAKDKEWMEDIESSLIFNLKAIGMCKWNIQEEIDRDLIKGENNG